MTDSAHPAAAHPLQRLVLLTNLLGDAGAPGLAALPLADRLGYAGTSESRRESLARDIRKLRDAGIEITNVAPAGDEARWVLRPGDSRVRLAFSSEQLAELQRAAWLADRHGMAGTLGSAVAPGTSVSVSGGAAPASLDAVTRAVAARCVLRFTYNGRPRTVHPAALHPDAGGWSLSGWDADRAAVRTFRVTRMSDVALDAPGSASEEGGANPAGTSTDPLTWPVDPPVTSELSGPSRYEPDVRRLLGAGVDVIVADAPGGMARYRADVTNRWVFLARVLELGERVRLDGPAELRAELGHRLRAAIEAAS